jgi:V8-like Glu-specific endopeptidase
MNLFYVFMVLISLERTEANVEVIYGVDNRKDVYQEKNSLYKKLAASTAGMVDRSLIVKSSKANFYHLKDVQTLEEKSNVCPTEAFSHQPIVATCSGFLVAPDILITAGHCYKTFTTPEIGCKSFAWIFGLQMNSSSDDPTKNIPINNIYLCQKIISSKLTPIKDFTVIKLDRPVEGRSPLTYRTTGTISNTQSLVVIGHSSLLPTKIADGGKITHNSDPTRFSTNLDTFQGNSGSPVFDAKSGVVEGILIEGKTDYILSKKSNPNSCLVVNVCDEDTKNCLNGKKTSVEPEFGEVVLRISRVMTSLKKSLELEDEKSVKK